jgi:hypothetical protein
MDIVSFLNEKMNLTLYQNNSEFMKRSLDSFWVNLHLAFLDY